MKRREAEREQQRVAVAKQKIKNPRAVCGFCGEPFRSVKARFQHAKDCKF